MDRRRTFGSDQPPTLLDMFEPPEGHLGGFGWLCGYSADPYFLNAAAERFTRRTQRRRAAEGDIAFGLVLDSGSPRISIVDAPGVLHFPLPQGQAFRLMHAKVSLLGFRKIDSDGWLLRLVVSTGNWTRETLEESLDLACCIEVAEDELGTEKANQRLVDVKAGAEFLMELREQIDDAPLRAASSVFHLYDGSITTSVTVVNHLYDGSITTTVLPHHFNFYKIFYVRPRSPLVYSRGFK